jgi:IS30 family transposase
MRDGRGRRMDEDGRAVIERGLASGRSARGAAREAGASPSTVAREARADRTVAGGVFDSLLIAQKSRAAFHS